MKIASEIAQTVDKSMANKKNLFGYTGSKAQLVKAMLVLRPYYLFDDGEFLEARGFAEAFPNEVAQLEMDIEKHGYDNVKERILAECFNHYSE